MIEICQSCGAKVPPSTTGATHNYLDASPGCWARFGEVLSREYSDVTYFSVHALTVDAYALQHPGQESPKTIQSINLHLASLYAYYKQHVALHELAQLKSTVAKQKNHFCWLEPPENLGTIAVNDVWKSETAQQHRESVIYWGEIVLNCWRSHYKYIEEICLFI